MERVLDNMEVHILRPALLIIHGITQGNGPTRHLLDLTDDLKRGGVAGEITVMVLKAQERLEGYPRAKRVPAVNESPDFDKFFSAPTLNSEIYPRRCRGLFLFLLPRLCLWRLGLVVAGQDRLGFLVVVLVVKGRKVVPKMSMMPQESSVTMDCNLVPPRASGKGLWYSMCIPGNIHPATKALKSLKRAKRFLLLF